VSPPTSAEVATLRASVLRWYDVNGRRLAFRGTIDPYLVLVSETILQQTQVSRGAPAWEQFTRRFPTIEALAAASPAEVLRAWRGLGYNRRALNLQRAARIVVDEHAGRLPHDVAGLERLPGVGPYTARAVAAIAYGLPVGAVDTNVRRVLGRAVAGDPEALRPAELQAIADRVVPPDRPADWTHALMDLGSTVCGPRDPACGDCPLRGACRHAAAARSRRGARAGRVTVASPSRNGDGAAVRERPVPFAATSRWLRGRILDRLREADGPAWTAISAPIGEHDGPAVAMALRALDRDGLIELDRTADPPRARLPIA
jgi:A/G-specific adenine glycosylase